MLARLDTRARLGLGIAIVGFAALTAGLRAAEWPAATARAAATVFVMATFFIAETIPLWATALIPLVAFPAFGVAGFREVLLQYFEPVNFLFLGGMLIAGAMEEWQLHRRIALSIVDRVGSSPRRIVLGFMIGTAFVSLWISNTAAAVMMFPIGMAVLQTLEKGATDKALVRRTGAALMLGIAYAASMGGIGSKIGTGPNLIFVKQAGELLPDGVSFVSWLAMGLPVVAVAIPLSWLYLVRVAEPLPAAPLPDAARIIKDARAALGRMRAGEAVALAAFLGAAFLWAFRQPIALGPLRWPGWSAFSPWSWADVFGRPPSELPRPFAALFGPSGQESVVAMVVGLSLLAIPVARRPWRMALPLRRVRAVSWDLLVLLGGGFAMAHGFAASGLSDRLAAGLHALSFPSPLLALMVVCVATTALSEVASNTATVSIMLPLLAVAARGFGLDPVTLMFAATLSASFGFMLPAGTPPNAIAYASGYLTVPRMAKSGLVVDLGGSVSIAALCYWLVPLVLGGAR